MTVVNTILFLFASIAFTCFQCAVFALANILAYKNVIKPFIPAHQSNLCIYTPEGSHWGLSITSTKMDINLFIPMYTLQTVRRRYNLCAMCSFIACGAV
uniref:Putative secreted protein n=1 Tax=Amblyomma triste TaxID=251400 RepID=A0A023G0C2_AMBTT